MAVAVGQVLTVDRKRRCHGCLSCSMRVNLGENLQSALKAVELAGVQFVEHRRQCGPPRGAGLVGDALRGLGQPQPAHPAVVGVDGADQQAVGRQLGHQRRCRVGYQPQLAGGLPHRDTRLTADQSQHLGLRLGQACGVEPSPGGPAKLAAEPSHHVEQLGDQIGTGVHDPIIPLLQRYCPPG